MGGVEAGAHPSARLSLSVNEEKLLLPSDLRSYMLMRFAAHDFGPVGSFGRVVKVSQMSDIPNGPGAQGSLGTPSFLIRILALLLLLCCCFLDKPAVPPLSDRRSDAAGTRLSNFKTAQLPVALSSSSSAVS